MLRSLPVFLDRGQQKPALSWRMATTLAGGVEPAVPAEGILRFLPPPGEITTLPGRPTGEALKHFEGAFVLVAVADPRDTHLTPWGEQPGQRLQVWAALSLVGGRHLSRLHPAWSFPTVFALCYLLTATLARRGGWRRLVALAAGLTLAWVALAAAATRRSVPTCRCLSPSSPGSTCGRD